MDELLEIVPFHEQDLIDILVITYVHKNISHQSQLFITGLDR
jgi:hypothetical protein